jgi:hypothetical protein
MKKIIIIFILIINSYPVFADQNMKNLEIAKNKFIKLYTAYQAEKELVADKNLEEIMAKLHSILINQKYNKFKIETENLTNDKDRHTVIFWDENDDIVLEIYLCFYVTYVHDSFSYFKADIKVNGRKYFLTFSVDNKNKEESLEHYNLCFLQFSFSDKNDPKFAFYNTYYTDRYEIYEIGKYENKKGFLELPICERITRYRYNLPPRSMD